MDSQVIGHTLPESFAEDLLDLEMDLEKNCKLETIRQLVSLYSVISNQRAIEYYELIKDNKYQAYHKRMKSLLQKTQVQQVLTASSKPFSRPVLSSINVNNLKSAESSENIQVDLTPCKSDQNKAPVRITKHASTKNMKSAELQIEDYCHETQNSKKQALSNIKNQEDIIEKKLKDRKLNRSLTLSAKIDGDKSAGRDRYQDELVEIMEKYLNQKIESCVGIKRKYQSQMEEIKCMGSGQIIVEVLNQMEKSMNEEIKELCIDLENRKSEEVAKIREVYFQ